MSEKWSYQVREINSSISLLADNRKFGTLYGSDNEAERKARLIVISPVLVELLVECAEFLEEHSMQCERCSEAALKLEERIEAVLVDFSRRYRI